MINLAHQYAVEHYGSVQQAQHENDGCCIDFAGELVESIPGARLAYFPCISHPVWKYHAAAEIYGVIHDLWHDAPLLLLDFMRTIGAAEVEYPVEQEAA